MSKAALTRLTILQKAFALIYRNGYQATSIDDIIAETQVTKGAFFYNFKNKEEMGLAVINEILYPGMYGSLVEPLQGAGDPVSEIYLMMKRLLLEDPLLDVKYGCPAVNMIDEMAPLNEAFNKALSRLAMKWQEAIEKSLKNGKTSGKIRKEVNVLQAAWFVMSGYSGVRNLGKIYGKDCYNVYLKELKHYLKGLEPAPVS